MPPPTNVRVRGIYSTALTTPLRQQGYCIVDASPAVQAWLRLPYWDALEGVGSRYVGTSGATARSWVNSIILARP